jgi:hypothetical protein
MKEDERQIVLALDREAERAPIPARIPPDVARRVTRQRAWRAVVLAASLMLTIGVVVLVLVQLAPLGADQRVRLNGHTNGPEHTDSVRDLTTLATGVDPIIGRWSLVAYMDDLDNSILELASDEGGGGGAGFGRLGDHVFGGISWGTSWIDEDQYSFDVVGLVSPSVSLVTLTLDDGTVLESILFPVPDRYFGEAKAFLVLGDRVLPDHRPLKGALTAYDAQGSLVDIENINGPDEPGGTSPETDAIITQLREVRDAIVRLDSGPDPFARFRLEQLQGFVPETPLNTEPAVVPDEVSVRVTDPSHLVVVAQVTEGPVFCIALERDRNPDGGWNYYYGLQDAAEYRDCDGGWDPYTLPPD